MCTRTANGSAFASENKAERHPRCRFSVFSLSPWERAGVRASSRKTLTNPAIGQRHFFGRFDHQRTQLRYAIVSHT